MPEPIQIVRAGVKAIAILGGVGLLTTGAIFAYQQITQRPWCVKLMSNGGQEVTYSQGCLHPQRYKKWVITAFTDSPTPHTYPLKKVPISEQT